MSLPLEFVPCHACWISYSDNSLLVDLPPSQLIISMVPNIRNSNVGQLHGKLFSRFTPCMWTPSIGGLKNCTVNSNTIWTHFIVKIKVGRLSRGVPKQRCLRWNLKSCSMCSKRSGSENEAAQEIWLSSDGRRGFCVLRAHENDPQGVRHWLR